MHKNDYLTSDDILGKEVIDSYGSLIGVIETLYIDHKNLKIAGIGVDKGFLRKGLIIGSRYIEKVTSHAVFLNIRPVFKIKGMDVYDLKGNRIGNVSSVELSEKGNEIKNLVIPKFTGNILIPASFISKIRQSVFLNVGKKKVETYNKKLK